MSIDAMTSQSNASPKARRTNASRGTRIELLEVAGEVFSARGYHGTSGKEICERAGVNAAAINYHFGGIEALFEAVLDEAWRHLPSFEAQMARESRGGAAAKLRAAIEVLVDTLAGASRSSWAVKLLAREMVEPSWATRRHLLSEGMRKLGALRTVVAEILELPEDHPAVARASGLVLAPSQVMIMSNTGLRNALMPDLSSELGTKAIAEHWLAFSLGGLAALKRSIAKTPHDPKKAAKRE